MNKQLFTKKQLIEINKDPSDFFSKKIQGIYIYAETENLFYELIKKYFDIIVDNLKEYLVINKSVFTRIVRFEKGIDVDLSLKSRLINKMYQLDIIDILPCCTYGNNTYYYTIYLKENVLKIKELLDNLLIQLKKGTAVNVYEFAKTNFRNKKGSSFWTRALFDHLYFEGIIDYNDVNNIRIIQK